MFLAERQPVADLVVHAAGQPDLAGLGEGLQPGGDVDPIAVNVGIVDDHLREIDADAELDAASLGHAGIALHHAPLHVERAAHRLDGAGKLGQQAVPGGADEPAAARADCRGYQLVANRLEAIERIFLIRPHQARIARDIGRQDCYEPAIHAAPDTYRALRARGRSYNRPYPANTAKLPPATRRGDGWRVNARRGQAPPS
jgi:hypothetical protein